MLSFFRSNQFFVALPLACYVLLLRLGALTGAVQAPPPPSGGGFLYQSWFAWFDTAPFYSAVTASLLVLAQALLVNALADEFRLMGDRNWFPGLFYALVATALPDFLYLSPPLAAATFMPFSIWRIYKAYQKPNITAVVFDGAFWIAVGSLFYPPCLWLLVAAFAGFGVVRVFRLRERFVFLTGAFVPLFFAWLWNFWTDRGASFRSVHWNDLYQFCRFSTVLDTVFVLKSALMTVLALIVLWGLGSLFHRKSIQTQKFISVLYWFLMVAGLSVLFRTAWHWDHLLLAAAPMAVMVALTFQGVRSRFWAEWWHLVMLAFVLLVQFADFFISLSNSIF